MAVDMYLKMEGIKGEAQDKTHKDEIDVLAWSWGASQSGTTHMGSGGGAGKVNIQDLSVTKYLDKSSNALLQHTFDGKHIPECTLFVRKAGGEQKDYFEIKMTDCIISSLSTGGSGGEDRLTENLSLNFSKVEVVYRAQKPDGSMDADMKAGWDIAENVTAV